MKHPKPYYTLEQIKAANEAIGGQWFKPATMRWFRSRCSYTIYSGRVFVSSERGPDEIRRYSVRICIDGYIHTVGGFGYTTNRRAAHSAASLIGQAVASALCQPNDDMAYDTLRDLLGATQAGELAELLEIKR